MDMIERLEKRVLYAAIFSTNSVKRLYTDPIGGDPTGSRVVRYKNVTTKSVTIPEGGVVISGAHAQHYRIISNYTLPRGLKPGASIKFSIVFDPPQGEDPGIKTGLLTVLTTTGASKSVRLRGIATTGIGGANEPSLQRVLELFQYRVAVGDSDSSTNALDIPPVTPNDELDIESLVKAGPGPVTVFPIASYIQVVNPSLRFGYYTPGNASAKTELFTLADTDAQSVNPNATGTITFDPGSTSFGLYATYPGLSRTAYTESALNTWESTIANRRKARFYPVRNKDHSIDPNSYLIAFEDLDSGEDFNDGVFIIKNVTTVA